ncbi:hypothetical protein HTZ84_03195 [Haloterrigena sp. SYSU A558-1]|uniref:Uncharacterized protein n=1 Tax=Haloterrigena gelatinilytica TaxID=2741724 RepID=A0A8J8GRR9_9EURY|nr:hypothetical protein [Haloterrigena gelatinilytica]NUB92762.1 hypothetical protein [Haloterrigena gelatinilytica]NUC71324.1 hypothetical protein [Haloterrigena gelatinilytica]
MPTPRRLRFVRTQVALLLGLLLALAAVGAFSPGLFVLLGVIGFVTAIELLTPAEVRPRWYGRVEVLVTLALVTAAAVAGVRTVQLFEPGLLP